MKQGMRGTLALVAVLVTAAGARAVTALVFVTPKNLKEGKFQVSHRTEAKDSVRFQITRDIRAIDGPGRRAFLAPEGSRALGVPVELEEDPGKRLTYRFTVPQARLKDMVFTLWGLGRGGEGITYRFRLDDFRDAPKTDTSR